MSEKLINPELHYSPEFASAQIQLNNINKWNDEYGLGLEVPDATKIQEMLDITSDTTVLTPNLADTEQTFYTLWEIIKQQYNGPTEEAFKYDQKYNQQIVLAIDEKSPDSLVNSRVKSLVNPGMKFAYSGERIVKRVPNRVSISEIDVTAHYKPLPEDVNMLEPKYLPPAPYQLRTPDNAPGVEVMAFLAHNPDYVKKMNPNAENHQPWLWVPGVQFHDKGGNYTARTPLISVLPNGVLKLAAVWNDTGNLNAAIPQLTQAPKTL